MGSTVYDARLMPHHMAPVLRHFFPNTPTLDEALGNGTDPCLVKLKDFKRLSTPHYLNDISLADGIVRNLETVLDLRACKKPGANPKIRYIDLDEALVLVLPVWMLCEQVFDESPSPRAPNQLSYVCALLRCCCALKHPSSPPTNLSHSLAAHFPATLGYA